MERIKELREEKELKQEQLGSELGYTQAAISAWERGVSEPNLSTLKRIANYFDVSIDYLIEYSNENYIDYFGEHKRTKIASSTESLSLDEKEVIKKYRSFDEQEQALFIEVVGLFSNQKNKEG